MAAGSFGDWLNGLAQIGEEALKESARASSPRPGKPGAKAGRAGSRLTGCTPCAANAQVEAAKRWTQKR